MARWKNKILLIPQRPGKRKIESGKGTYVTDNSIQIAIFDEDSVHTNRYHTITNIAHLSIKNSNVLDSIRGYGGIEGAVILENTNSIYFTIETDIETCYIVKGFINEADSSIQLDEKILPLSKPQDKGDTANDNAGFESIAYLPKQNKLIAFFERNRYLDVDRAMLIDTSLNTSTIQYLKFARPLLFRLTDVAYWGDDTLIGINHHYNDCHKDTIEFKYYIGKENIENAKAAMFGENPSRFSFTRIIKIFFTKDNKIDWKEVQNPVSFSDDNREGVLPFKDGVLMVADGVPPGKPCRLSYFNLKDQ
ncbi:esterase-like activity of phytase family protein [Parafilimonas sp.]|uniref:esterase-like activity of phytase family protein n=1 Tax=Parafilimonas sp. TaxID=1969739 RepID=UPI0039E34C10